MTLLPFVFDRERMKWLIQSALEVAKTSHHRSFAAAKPANGDGAGRDSRRTDGGNGSESMELNRLAGEERRVARGTLETPSCPDFRGQRNIDRRSGLMVYSTSNPLQSATKLSRVYHLNPLLRARSQLATRASVLTSL